MFANCAKKNCSQPTYLFERSLKRREGNVQKINRNKLQLLLLTISDSIAKLGNSRSDEYKISNESLSLDVARSSVYASFCSERKKKRRKSVSEAYRYPFSSRHDVSKRFKCKCVVKSTRFRLPRHLHANIAPVSRHIVPFCTFFFFFFFLRIT